MAKRKKPAPARLARFQVLETHRDIIGGRPIKLVEGQIVHLPKDIAEGKKYLREILAPDVPKGEIVIQTNADIDAESVQGAEVVAEEDDEGEE